MFKQVLLKFLSFQGLVRVWALQKSDTKLPSEKHNNLFNRQQLEGGESNSGSH